MAYSLCLCRQSIALWKFIVEGKNRCEEPYKNTYSSTVEFSAKMTGDAEKVTPSRGIKVNEIFYQSPRLRRPELYEQQVEVRYDPFNMAHVYALVGKEWIVCYAPPAIYAKLKDCTEREVKIFSED